MITWDSICSSFWWVFPLVMIVLCILIMRGRNCSRMCGFGTHDVDKQRISYVDLAIDTPDKEYTIDESNKEEYEEKK